MTVLPEVTPVGRASTEVVLYSTAGCRYCTHARVILQRLAEETPLRVREVELESVEGVAALQRWRVPFPPILLVDGVLHGYGRISERKLRRRLSAAGG